MDKAEARVVKQGNQWCVVSEDGSKNLGCSKTKQGAEKRLREVEYFKHAKGKDMNYEQAFRNMARSHKGDIDPADVGQAPEARPRKVHVPSDSIIEGFSSGSIAGQISQRLLDKKDHFPVFTETQARSSMSRAMQLSDVPVWYSGSMDDLRKEVYEGIVKAHPTLASLNVNIPASRVVALSDGETPAATSKTKIKDPNDVVKTEVPGVRRPTLTSAEMAEACQDANTRIVIAGKLMECLERQEEDLASAKELAGRLLEDGLSSEEFHVLNTYLQSDILRELLYNQSNAAEASSDDRRKELLGRLNKKD